MAIERHKWFYALVLLGVVLRLGFLLAADSSQPTFHSGGSDAPSYVLLATNLLNHAGLSYAGQPSAFRPPGYPLFVAGFMAVFHGHYISAIRWTQFLLGMLTVGVCALAARRLFGRRAAEVTFVAGLFLPTLVFTTAQVLTECLAAFLTALYLHAAIVQDKKADVRSAVGLGAFAGLESLVRFDAAALPIFAGWAVWRNPARPLWLRLAAVLLLPVVVAAPWFIRNELVFHGQVLYSTHTGANAVQGVLTSQGRTQPGETEKLLKGMGWALQELETNGPSRRALGSEVELNRHAMQVLPGLWKDEGSHAVVLLAKKVADFWLSRDQLVDVGSLNLRERVLRLGGVVSQWIILALAGLGWLALRKLHPRVASFFLIYAVGNTVMHLPFVMNTRLRIPLMEPLVLILAGGGWERMMDYLVIPVEETPMQTVAPAEAVAESRTLPDTGSSA